MPTITPIKSGAFLNSSKRLTELTRIRSASITLLKYKKDRIKLELKYKQTRDKFEARQNILDREKTQEDKKKKTIKSKLARKTERAFSGGLLDLLFTFAKLKVLLWAADPKNAKVLQGIFEFGKGLFKVIDFFATIGVEGLFGGLGDLVSPESTNIQRLFAVFKIFGGFFILSKLLRWSNPLNAIKDIQKNKGVISKIFKSLASRDFKSALDGIRKLLTPQLFRKGLGQSIQRVVLKVFGKGGLKAVQALATKLGFKTAQQLVKSGLAKGAATIGKRIPLVGPFIGLGINLLMGVPLDVSIVRFAGAAAGEWIGRIVFGLLGAFLGSIVPGAGTALGGAAGLAVGGIIGNLIGEWLSDLIYGGLKSIFGGKKKDEPALAVGGIVTKPTRALIGEAGPEAVIPLGQIYNGSILNAPLGIVASAMIGGIDALITSLGPVGLSVRPFASQLLAPYSREFGKQNYTFSSDLAKKSGATIKAPVGKDAKDQELLNSVIGSDLSLTIIDKKRDDKQDRYNTGSSVREILADILNNIINLDFRRKDDNKKTKKPDGTIDTTGNFTGSANAEKAFNYLKSKGLTAEQAAGLVGNFMQEAGHNIDPTIANRSGHKGIAQWDPKDRWPKLVQFAQNKGLNPETLEAQLQFVWYELETGDGGLSLSTLKSAKTVKQAAHLFVTQYERSGEEPGHRGYENRITYGNQVFSKYAKLQTGGVVATQGVPDTGSGYTIQGTSDSSGRPVVFSQPAASAFEKMMKDSGGVVKGSDIASSKRSIAKNKHEGGATRSKHLYGIGMDIHNSSKEWIKKNGAKYGWIWAPYGGPRDHGGHFEFAGAGIAPSDVNQQKQESSPNQDTSPPEVNWGDVATHLGDLFKMLNPSATSINSASLATQSMDFLQAAKMDLKVSDTYIISQESTMVSNFNVLTPLPQTDYSIGGFSYMDSSAYQLQSKL